MKEIIEMTTEELENLKEDIRKEISSRNEEKNGSRRIELHLRSNAYKGSGKCWIAKVDEYKKILGFIEPHTVIPDDYKKEKIFFLEDGSYLSCEAGSKCHDTRKYFKVKNGEKE